MVHLADCSAHFSLFFTRTMYTIATEVECQVFLTFLESTSDVLQMKTFPQQHFPFPFYCWESIGKGVNQPTIILPCKKTKQNKTKHINSNSEAYIKKV